MSCFLWYAYLFSRAELTVAILREPCDNSVRAWLSARIPAAFDIPSWPTQFEVILIISAINNIWGPEECEQEYHLYF